MSDLKALIPAVCVIGAMSVADLIFQPSSWTLVIATALATAVAYGLGRPRTENSSKTQSTKEMPRSPAA